MSILLDKLQAGRDAQPGQASLIMRYALWLASCARESSAAQNGPSSDLSSESAVHRVKNLHVRRDMRTREGVCARKEECVMLLQSSGRIDAECEVVATGLGHAEWQEVDRRLREYAHRRSALDAAEAFDLVRAEQLKIYVSFGFVSLYEYMERVLGYKPHTARERMRVARALAALPRNHGRAGPRRAVLLRGARAHAGRDRRD